MNIFRSETAFKTMVAIIISTIGLCTISHQTKIRYQKGIQAAQVTIVGNHQRNISQYQIIPTIKESSGINKTSSFDFFQQVYQRCSKNGLQIRHIDPTSNEDDHEVSIEIEGNINSLLNLVNDIENSHSDWGIPYLQLRHKQDWRYRLEMRICLGKSSSLEGNFPKTNMNINELSRLFFYEQNSNEQENTIPESRSDQYSLTGTIKKESGRVSVHISDLNTGTVMIMPFNGSLQQYQHKLVNGRHYLIIDEEYHLLQ